jgi:flagellar biosynthesis/type III secretory pathway chaperone
MKTPLEEVIEALRDELKHYGAMLALLESQRDHLTRQDARSILNSCATLDAQRTAIEGARARRETLQHQLAWVLGRPENPAFRNLLPLIPGDYHPLISALTREINELIESVHERIQTNHSLLRRSLELTERFLSTISSQAHSALLAEERNSSGADSPHCTVSAAIV